MPTGMIGRQDPEILNPVGCKKCGGLKPYKEFTFKKDRNDYDKTCRACRNAGRRKESDVESKEQFDDFVDTEPQAAEFLEEDSTDSGKRMASAEIEQEEFDRAVRVFKLLKKWHDEALARGPIEGWKSIGDNT